MKDMFQMNMMIIDPDTVVHLNILITTGILHIKNQFLEALVIIRMITPQIVEETLGITLLPEEVFWELHMVLTQGLVRGTILIGSIPPLESRHPDILKEIDKRKARSNLPRVQSTGIGKRNRLR
jgi:hypothetical protein